MFEAVSSPYLVPFDGSFERNLFSTEAPEDAPGKSKLNDKLVELTEELAELQSMLYANDNHALLLIFQAMDAAGKDSTIRAVMNGIDPAGVDVHSFKQPNAEELDHDFLWRSTVRLPDRGRIGIFNRSYYEEVLVVRVHPEFLAAQKLPDRVPLEELWSQRFESIRQHEEHLARNGIVVLKFWLNVSKDEQRERFLARLEEPHKNWKFSVGDVKEREHWDSYMSAYEAALRETSRPWAPWYAIPADKKSYLRVSVADIVVRSLRQLGLRYPEPQEEDRARFAQMQALLEE